MNKLRVQVEIRFTKMSKNSDDNLTEWQRRQMQAEEDANERRKADYRRRQALDKLQPAEMFMDKIKHKIEYSEKFQKLLLDDSSDPSNNKIEIVDGHWPAGMSTKVSYPKELREMKITDREMCESFPLVGSITRTIREGPFTFYTLVGKRPITSLITNSFSIYLSLVPTWKKWFFL